MDVPMHSAVLRGVTVRFFPPAKDRPRLPLVALDDLLRAIGLPREAVRVTTQKMLEGQPDSIRQVDTEEGIVGLVPHWAASTLVDAFAGCGTAAPGARDWFDRALNAAVAVQLKDMPDPLARMAFVMEAAGEGTH